VHALGETIDVLWGDTRLVTYAYGLPMPAYESPKPYLHPVRTLAGDVVTAYRPHDHVWHKGIQMTAPNLSGQNFWGGATYVHGSDYIDLPNNGRMEHMGWEAVESDGRSARLAERLEWRTEAGEHWIDERRVVEIGRVDSHSGSYALEFSFQLHNVAGRELVFASPATEGRPDAGYGGLFWRGPRSFLEGPIVTAEREGPEAMGKRSPWLAFTGRHDENDRESTLIFVDHESNLRYPNQWFVRNDPIACVSFAFAFSETLPLPAGEELRLRYAIVIANGALDRADIERLAASRLM
jgi:methane monooxygenase PmoA-like